MRSFRHLLQSPTRERAIVCIEGERGGYKFVHLSLLAQSVAVRLCLWIHVQRGEFWESYENVYVRMLYLLDTVLFTLFRARFSSNYASNTVHERFECVFVFGCGFSVNFNVDMYLVLRSPISRR